ncbi:MAG TPA: TlpA disulfide reductase family protein, partial [Chthoniobacteraceae bacterium]
ARSAPATQREQLLAAARKFHLAHPADRRIGSLLTEVATLFDDQPKVKTELLRQADSAATEPGLKRRIADDLRRVDLLGQPLALGFTSLKGEAIRLEDFRGRVVLIVFFADFSPPSTQMLAKIRETLAALKKEPIAVLGVNLDPERRTAESAVKAAEIAWPVAFDGKSWEGELVRSLSVNALPTVWLVDKRGVLRSINAVADPLTQIRPLLRE